MIPDGYIPASQVARTIPIAPNKVSLACRQGRLQGIQIGRNWYIPREAAAAYIEDRRAFLARADKPVLRQSFARVIDTLVQMARRRIITRGAAVALVCREQIEDEWKNQLIRDQLIEQTDSSQGERILKSLTEAYNA